MTNQLADETSPYLQQHAENPVEWYPWNATALEKARLENKPILLSIGYSACHWCHVMAHESFEDKTTAELMNKLFINIKVDREERPDLDKIYQTAHQILAQRAGGWPLTLFLRPHNQMPFFAGTYFPNEPRRGMPSFRQVMQEVYDWYQSHPGELQQQNDQLSGILHQVAAGDSGSALPDPEVFQDAYENLANSFDRDLGGFGKAPKFPHPTNLEYLLRYWNQSRYIDMENRDARHMLIFSLQQMALGGMYDQIGGGFCRYSVDDQWMIPHFEKMLYDNGPLLAIYTQCYASTGIDLFRRIATETATWVMHEMQAPSGGYYSSLDADSEGEEGKFYTWDNQELTGLLTQEEYSIASLRFGFDRPANFEGKWNPHVYMSLAQIAKTMEIDETEVHNTLDRAKHKMFEFRERRVHPGRDEKVLTSWNALMIKGMSSAARYLGKPEYAISAQRALDFIQQNLWQDNRLMATHKDGKTHLNAYLDDYAYLIEAVLELLQYEWRSKDIDFACKLADVLLDQFEDTGNGGFYFTSNDHEALIQRPKPYTDEAIPAGNGVAAYALQRLGYLVGNTQYLDAAERCLKDASPTIEKHSYACMSMLVALEEHKYSVQTVIVRTNASELASCRDKLCRIYQPRQQVFVIDEEATDLPEAIASKPAMESTVAYVCDGMTCSTPQYNLDEILIVNIQQ